MDLDSGARTSQASSTRLDLLPLDLGDWAENLIGSSTSHQSQVFGVLVEAPAGDDAWLLQLRFAALALGDQPDVRIVVLAPRWTRGGVEVALHTAIADTPLGMSAVVLSLEALAVEDWVALVRGCGAYLAPGALRQAYAARLAGATVVETGDHEALTALHAAYRRKQPVKTVAAGWRTQQAAYLAAQLAAHRGQLSAWVVGDEALASALGQGKGVTVEAPGTPGSQPGLVVCAGASQTEAWWSELPPGCVLLLEDPDAAAPAADFLALGGTGWRAFRRGPCPPTPAPWPVKHVLVTHHPELHAGARRLCRTLAGLGYELTVVGPSLDELGGFELAPGASLAELVDGLAPDARPELLLHLARSAADPWPARGIDHLEFPAVCCLMGQALAADMTPAWVEDFDAVGAASPAWVAALEEQGFTGAFLLPAGLLPGAFAAAEPAREPAQAERERQLAIELVLRAQTLPSRGLALLAGHQYFALGALGQAIGAFELAARDRRRSAEALVNLGVCMHALGRPDEAVKLLEAALVLYPKSRSARENLAALQSTARAADDSLLARELPSYYRLVRSEILGMIPSGVKRLLDVGCAAGALGEAVKQLAPEIEVVGIEYDQVAALHAAKRLDAVLYGSVETLQWPFPPGYFDCIILADVLEHLTDPEAALERLLPLLRADGHLVVSLPNVRYYEVVDQLLTHGRFEYQDAGILDRTHLRFYTYSEIVAWLHRANLEVVALGANVGVPDPQRLGELERVVGSLGGNEREFKYEAPVIQYLLRLRKPQAHERVLPGAYRPVESRPLAPLAAPPVASLVVLTLNQLPYTRKCLDSVFANASLPLELIVVDNGSTDGTRDYLRELARRDPRVKVVYNDANRGFAYGCNQGIVLARGQLVVLLNNDTVVTAGWLEGLLTPMLRDPAIGATGPTSNQISGPQRLSFVPYADDLGLMAQFASWREFMHRGGGRQVTRLVGFCLAIRRTVLERIGGLDTRFAIGNMEDDDLGLRVQTAGFKLWLCDDVFVHHYGSVTFKGENIAYVDRLLDNWDLFKAKWGMGPLVSRNKGYSNALAALPFEASRDVFPILVKEAASAPIDQPAGYQFLLAPDWDAMEETASGAIAAFCQAFTALDDVALLLWVDPAGPHTVTEVAERLGALLAAMGLDHADSAALTLFDAPGGPLEIAGVINAARAYLAVPGADGLAMAARACGRVVIEDIKAGTLRAAFDARATAG